jgi:hypothetical protein
MSRLQRIFTAPPSRTGLERFFFLDDADEAPIAGRGSGMSHRSDRPSLLTPAVVQVGTPNILPAASENRYAADAPPH